MKGLSEWLECRAHHLQMYKKAFLHLHLHLHLRSHMDLLPRPVWTSRAGEPRRMHSHSIWYAAMVSMSRESGEGEAWEDKPAGGMWQWCVGVRQEGGCKGEV